jgi:hypothetical protein
VASYHLCVEVESSEDEDTMLVLLQLMVRLARTHTPDPVMGASLSIFRDDEDGPVALGPVAPPRFVPINPE